MKVMQEEESSFLRTLEKGIVMLQEVIDETKAAGKTMIAGDKAFTLFDTFGFPLDLTELICREQNMTLDEDGFNKCMEEQKNRARNAAEVKLGDWVTISDAESSFVGYDYTEYPCHIVKYREVK
jgi:alanyl-tRNA synthetase